MKLPTLVFTTALMCFTLACLPVTTTQQALLLLFFPATLTAIASADYLFFGKRLRRQARPRSPQIKEPDDHDTMMLCSAVILYTKFDPQAKDIDKKDVFEALTILFPTDLVDKSLDYLSAVERAQS